MKYFFATIFLIVAIFGINFIKGLPSESTTEENIVYIEKRFADNIKRRVARALTKDRVVPINDQELDNDFKRDRRNIIKFDNKRFKREDSSNSNVFEVVTSKGGESSSNSEEDSASGSSILDYQYKQY
uniref:Seminal fluid protein HACP016 n=1 Tax=Strongyloides papillosus TaxID=174720 RepID=A0A0N5BET1_STREA